MATVERLCGWMRKKGPVKIGQACMYGDWAVASEGFQNEAGRATLVLEDRAGVKPVEWAAWHQDTPADLLQQLQKLT